MCANVCVSAPIRLPCDFSLALSLVRLSCHILDTLLYLIYFIIIPEVPVYFLKRDRKGVDLDGREGGKNREA